MSSENFIKLPDLLQNERSIVAVMLVPRIYWLYPFQSGKTPFFIKNGNFVCETKLNLMVRLVLELYGAIN